MNQDLFKKEITTEIMGKTWTIIETEETDKDYALGQTFETARKIIIYNYEPADILNPRKLYNQVMRHELLHAYMFECGLGDDLRYNDHGHDETTIDWMARIYPRYKKTCRELKVED
ncbi:MAG: hypothetical protein Q4E88_02875 [Coriobacteriia bacterium]|nr:hypothetical protein [Coriobacteriia bacterium]